MSSSAWDADGPSDQDAPPGRVRHWVVFAAMLTSLLLYLDRFCVSFAERYIKEELALTDTQMGLFLSVFFLTYAIAQVPGGWLGDRYGARITLTLYVLAWSLFTAFIGAAWSFVLLLAMRAAVGLAQAGAYPVCGSLLSKWVPLTNRATASSIVAFGGRVGGVIAPLLTGYLMVLFVPLSHSSLLAERDLLDPAGLAQTLAPQSGEAPSTPGAKTAAAVARDLFDALPRDVQGVIVATAREGREPTPAERRTLTAGLNAALHDPGLFRGMDLRYLPLPREARTLESKPSTLTEREATRLNRHVLEAAFPDHVGKIYTHGWRPVMYVYGAAGLLVAAFFWSVARDRPEDHPAVNNAERRLIAAGRPDEGPARQAVGRVPWGPMLRSGSLWCNSLMQIGTNIGWVFVVTWFPRYLKDVHQVPILERAWMSSVPLMCGIVGMLWGGRLADWIAQRIDARWSRSLPISATRFLAGAAFVGCVLFESPWGVTAALGLMAFATDLGIGCVWAYAQDVGGRYAGCVLGWANMWGNLGAFASPMLLNWLIEVFSWRAMFLMCAVAFALAGLLSLGMDARGTITADDGE